MTLGTIFEEREAVDGGCSSPATLPSLYFIFCSWEFLEITPNVQARVGWSYLSSNRIKMSHAGTCFTPRMFRVHALAVDPLNTE